jgi:hypothetical protein
MKLYVLVMQFFKILVSRRNKSLACCVKLGQHSAPIDRSKRLLQIAHTALALTLRKSELWNSVHTILLL